MIPHHIFMPCKNRPEDNGLFKTAIIIENTKAIIERPITERSRLGDANEYEFSLTVSRIFNTSDLLCLINSRFKYLSRVAIHAFRLVHDGSPSWTLKFGQLQLLTKVPVCASFPKNNVQLKSKLATQTSLPLKFIPINNFHEGNGPFSTS